MMWCVAYCPVSGISSGLCHTPPMRLPSACGFSIWCTRSTQGPAALMTQRARTRTRRPESVHLFDQLVRTLPDGVFYSQVQQTVNRIELDGTAESSTRVSALMRNIEASPWLKSPALEVVEAKEDKTSGIRRSNFRVAARQVTMDAEEVGEAAP